jgi:hypothetical protein
MATTLSDQKLGELLRLVEDADSVELKLTQRRGSSWTTSPCSARSWS